MFRLIIATLALFILSGCIPNVLGFGGEEKTQEQELVKQNDERNQQSVVDQEEEEVVELDGSIPQDTLLVDFSTEWSGYQTEHYAKIVPPGESEKTIFALIGSTYPPGDCDVGLGVSLEEAVGCVVDELTRQDFKVIRGEIVKVNNLRAVTIQAEVFSDTLTLVIFSYPKEEPQDFTTGMYIMGIDEKHDEYLPVFQQMVQSARTVVID